MREALHALVAGSRALRLPVGGGRATPERIDSVVLVGATCAGKTTLAEAVRASPLVRDGRVAVPIRFVTRAPRQGDTATENAHVSREEFERRTRSREIRLHWIRRFPDGVEERYGFPLVPPRAFPVYSGNNALLADDARVEPCAALRRALVVGVVAPDPVRAARLSARSPDLLATRPTEAAHRLAEDSTVALARAHVVVENHGPLEAVATAEVVRLVAAALEWARTPMPAGRRP